jgi:Zn-dependent peptidase ImmA (M78 family)
MKNDFDSIPKYEKAKEAALEILDVFGYIQPPVNPVKIARELGIRVLFGNLDAKYNHISGFYDAEENTIFVNKSEYAPRQIFTVAHELGHTRLHQDWVKSADYKVLYRDQLLEAKDPKEQEANCFAAHLLVPKYMLDKYYGIASVSELASLFAVSTQVIQNRIKLEY